jgi:hypothetical protein
VEHLTSAAKGDLIDEIIPGETARATAKACCAWGGTMLHVTEDGSTRSSLDINLADAEITVGDLPGLDALLDGQADKLEDIRAVNLGHFAAGSGRDGRAFSTIYYGGRHDP